MCFSEGERAMALEAALVTQDPFGYRIKDLYNYNYTYLGNSSYEDFNYNPIEKDQEQSCFSFLENQTENNYPSHEVHHGSNSNPCNSESSNIHNNNNSLIRHKRRRAKSRKNKEEIENQRMTHITVERNRRKQMNEYLSVLRSLMPESYVQRGDQASIIGGAINFVKELEQRLQFLGAQKEKEGKSDSDLDTDMPFSEFFTFPQYSIRSSNISGCDNNNFEQGCGIADIEVTMVESHANVKIRSKKRPKQLLKMVSSLNVLGLTILHLYVTTNGEIVLYTLNVKMEDDCQLGSVEEIAVAVYQMLDRIQQELMLNKDPNLI